MVQKIKINNTNLFIGASKLTEDEIDSLQQLIQFQRKEAQKELLEEIRTDFDNVHMINIDKYILEKFNKLEKE